MSWLTDTWQTRNAISLLLWPLSIIYCLLAVVRRWLYLSGVCRRRTLSVPVIVVGNITVGGSGKTPLVIWLAKWLREQRYRPGVVLRGYRGRSASWPREVRDDSSADEVGDEAVLLAQETGCPVVVAPDRVAAVQYLLDRHDCSVVISDDGLQHYRMQRDLEIAVVDAERRYGNGFCLPAGPLREPRWRSRSVDLNIINGTGGADELTMQLRPTGFHNLKTGERVGPDHFAGIAVHALAGIGNPSRFFGTLKQLGSDIESHAFPDHYRYTREDIVFNDAQVIMTGKDAVKCREFADERHWVLSVEAVPDSAVVERLSHRLRTLPGG